MTPQTLKDPRTIVEAIVRRHGEPHSFAASRAQALENYFESPSPDRVLHLWRYTDPGLFAPGPSEIEAVGQVGSSNPPRGLPPTLHQLFVRGDVGAIVHMTEAGRARSELSDELKSKGVRCLDLHDALTTAPALVHAHLGKLVGSEVTDQGVGKFEALNHALWSTGTLIHVPAHVHVSKPIHLWLEAPSNAASSFLATRVLVVVEEGAEVTIVDECEGGSETLKLNSAVEVFAGQASRVRYVSVQRLNRNTVYHVAERASVARDAHLLTAIASLGAGVTKSDFGSHLRGPGSNVELFGFLFGEGRQHFDHHTVHDHEAGRSHSNLDFKVVLKDKSRSAYTGLIRIEPGCPDSEAYQENRNLLLNDGAKAESIPELEILTDEVKCTHGATMGTLDEQHIFYLLSRGIDRAEAIRLIVGGFIEPTLSRLDSDLRERLRAHVEERVKDL